MNNTYKIQADTVARTIILALALINQILSATGHAVIPIQDADIETLVSTAFTVLMAVINWWFNNSYTQAALYGDEMKNDAKRIAKEAKKGE